MTSPTFPAKWGSAHGEDAYGIWQDFSYKTRVQRMRWIESGTFYMGPQDLDKGGSSYEHNYSMSDELPTHQVTITKGFWLADTPITNTLFDALPVAFAKNGTNTDSETPVSGVKYADILGVIDIINDFFGTDAFRLPTEAEWEYACRAGTTTMMHWEPVTMYDVNYDCRYPVYGHKSDNPRFDTENVKGFDAVTGGGDSPTITHFYNPNAWGLYQMHGNVWEVCSDLFGYYSAEHAIDPQGPATGLFRVVRGGSFYDPGARTRSAARYCIKDNVSSYAVGFRLAATE